MKDSLQQAITMLSTVIKLVSMEQESVANVVTSDILERDFHYADSALKELKHSLEKELG